MRNRRAGPSVSESVHGQQTGEAAGRGQQCKCWVEVTGQRTSHPPSIIPSLCGSIKPEMSGLNLTAGAHVHSHAYSFAHTKILYMQTGEQLLF